MFETLKESLSKKNENGGLYKNIMKLEIGNTYVVRLIPNLNDINKTFFHHVQHGWNSFATGQFVSALSLPKGEYDPIGQTRYKMLYKSSNDADRVKGAEIKRSEKWLVNVLVVDDPINKINNGKIMILRYGTQLKKVIDDAMSDSDEYGERIFDLSEKGCNLKIKVEKQGDYPYYGSSRFTSPKEIEGLDSKKQEQIYEGIYDLENVYAKKNADELQKLLDEHFFCNVAASGSISKQKKDAAETNIDLVEKKTVVKSNPVSKKKDDNEEDLIKNLLDGLEPNESNS
jgi:hypothetical protein